MSCFGSSYRHTEQVLFCVTNKKDSVAIHGRFNCVEDFLQVKIIIFNLRKQPTFHYTTTGFLAITSEEQAQKG